MDEPDAHWPLVIVGGGRLGTALARALRASGRRVAGPYGRDEHKRERPDGPHAVLLCVPDQAIATAAGAIRPGADVLVGHCSGATTLAALAPHEAFSVHPLMTVPDDGVDFTGVTAAVDGSSPRARAVAVDLANDLGMVPVDVGDDDRAAYHAGAAIAANQLHTVLDLAERLVGSAGLDRAHLGPLVRAAVANWERLGASVALTGPVARGDETTVAAHRHVVAARAPDELDLYDELIAATKRLAAHGREIPR